MRRRPLAVALLAAALPAAALAPGLGSAQASATRTVGSHVSIKSESLTFSGRVSASRAVCQSHRRVTLYRAPSLVLGSTTTNSAGRWKLRVAGSAGITLGTFDAKALKRRVTRSGTTYVCKAATSKTIAYSP
jgi:hypothetical protein